MKTCRWKKGLLPTKHATDGSCRKKEQDKGSDRYQLLGIFIVCCEHGHIYGFHMMIDPEGRKDLFHLLYERYPQTELDGLTVVCINKHPFFS